jgi:hypothetical protein
LSPPVPPAASSLQTSGYDGNPVAFNTDVIYVCQRKQKFLDNFDQTGVKAKCLPENKWLLPEQWGTCVESKKYLKLISFYFQPFHIYLKLMFLLSESSQVSNKGLEKGKVYLNIHLKLELTNAKKLFNAS